MSKQRFEVNNLQSEVRTLQVTLDNLKEDMRILQTEKDAQLRTISTLQAEKDAQYQAFIKSTSWRVTAPFRAIIRLVKRIGRVSKRLVRLCKPQNFNRGMRFFRTYGLRALLTAIYSKLRGKQEVIVYNEIAMHQCNMTYERWINENEPDDIELNAQRKVTFKYAPKISIITPLYKTPEKFLVDLLESVCSQTYSNWELCLIDAENEPSIQEIISSYSTNNKNILYKKLDRNLGISENTNEALKIATGCYVICLDHDDMLLPFALYEVVKAINHDTEIDVIYSDQDKNTYDSGNRNDPFFKPDWSLEYLRQVMYIGHLLCVKKSIIQELNGFDKRYDGVQDFELMLRLSEKTNKIYHIPKVLYHWRICDTSLSGNMNAKSNIDNLQKEAVNAHLLRCRIDGNAISLGYHRTRIVPNKKKHYPKVSIIIPTKNSPELIGPCLHSIFDKTSYPNFEVIIGDNGTTDSRAKEILRSYKVRIVGYDRQFNYSEINNICANESEGEYLVFLNNDTEIMTNDWLEEMLFYSERVDVGAVGALLVYPNMTVQHAGIVLGMRGTADHVMRGFPVDSDGYCGSLTCAREVSAVTAACMMIKKKLFFDIGGFNQHYATHYQDLDLCCTLLSMGYRNIFAPNAKVKHHESYTRKDFYDFVDRYLFLDRFGQLVTQGDRYYNVNFNLQNGNYQIGEQRHEKNTFCPVR